MVIPAAAVIVVAVKVVVVIPAAAAAEVVVIHTNGADLFKSVWWGVGVGQEVGEHDDTGLRLSGVFTESSVSSSSSRIDSFLGWPPEPLFKEHSIEHCMRHLLTPGYRLVLRGKSVQEDCTN